MVADSYARIYAAVRRIPPGRVATYGQIARIAGRVGARQVGYALHALNDESVPWHRVINARGAISLGGEAGEVQRAMLEGEGVVIDPRGRVDVKRYRWEVGLGSK